MTAEEIQFAEQILPQYFPLLMIDAFEIESPRTIRYNCIGWAAGDDQNVWWPGGKYWPTGIRLDESVAAFVGAFTTVGYAPCDSVNLELGFEKIAVYVNDQGAVTHAARQLPDGRWTSKLGPQWDINHSLGSVCGPAPAYGRVAQILKRPNPSQTTAS